MKGTSNENTHAGIKLSKGILKGKKVKLKISKLSKPDNEETTTLLKKLRPSTPEYINNKCLECENMKDFILGLQGEVQRLQVSKRPILTLCD